MRSLLISLWLVLCPTLAEIGLAQDESPEAKGYRLTEEAQTKGEGFQWSTAEGRMVLIDAAGVRAERRFVSKVLEETDGGEGGRGLLVFSFPPDIAKTALLTISNKDRDDDQWLYLPALKRVKRVAAAGQTGSFVGSEFTFEDLRPSDKDDFNHTWLADGVCPSLPELQCHQIERDPLDEDSGYSRIVVYLDTQELRLTAAEYYDRSGRLLKVMTVSSFTHYKEKYWRANNLRMVNKVTGKITEMIWESFDFDSPLSEDDLSTRALERLQ